MLTNNGLSPTENLTTDRPIIARDKDLEEFRKSAIPDRLTLANVQFVEGRDAAKLFKPLDTTSKGFDLGRGKEQWRKWTHSDQGGAIVQGGWIFFGCNMDGTPATVPLFKPNKPREDDSVPGKTKLIKYETPPKSEATPLLPWVTWEFGLQIAANISNQAENSYVERFQTFIAREQAAQEEPDSDRQPSGSSSVNSVLSPDIADVLSRTSFGELNEPSGGRIDRALRSTDPTFWLWHQSVGGPVAVCEGLKKAKSLIAHGVAAVAIRGITQWHQKGSKHLHPLIAQLLQPDQTVYIIFDQDSKETTRKAVRKQAVDLGAAIEAMDCVPLAVGWDEAIGKGIDDALYLKGLGAKNWLEYILEKAVPPIENLPAAEAKTANIDRLSAIVASAPVWQTEDRIGMIDIPINSHKESISLKDPRFRSWLAAEFYEKTGRHCSSDAIGQLTERLTGQALSAPTHKIFHRVARIGEEIFIDLGDRDHTIIKVCGAGWAIHEGDCPAKFRRPNSMKALPVPSKHGDWTGLKKLLNLRDDDWILLLSWLSWGLHPNSPHPVLILNGEHGTAKSSTCEIIKQLLDPSKALLLSMPEDAEGLQGHASNRWVLAYDNLSGISKKMSDLLCTVATESGFAKRMLYTDADETIFEGVRPIVLNGIEALATRPDLLDRSIILNLQPITDENRMTKGELNALLKDCESNVFACLLNSLAQGLRRLDTTRPSSLGRMADFHQWGHCTETAFGFEPGSFEAAYQSNRRMLNETAIDNDAIATALISLLDTKDFVGTASDLLTELGKMVTEEQRKAPDWIKSPSVLGRRLARLAPELRKRGYEFSKCKRDGPNRILKIEKIIVPESVPIVIEEVIEFTAEYHEPTEPTEPLEVGEDVVFVDSDDEEQNRVHFYKLLDFDIDVGSCTIEMALGGQKCVSRLEWLKRREERSA
jgi:hypothetical protein